MGGTCPPTAKRPHSSQAPTLGSWRVCCESLLASEGLGLGEPSCSPSVSQAQPRSLLLPPPLSQGSPSPVAKPLPSRPDTDLEEQVASTRQGRGPSCHRDSGPGRPRVSEHCGGLELLSGILLDSCARGLVSLPLEESTELPHPEQGRRAGGVYPDHAAPVR